MNFNDAYSDISTSSIRDIKDMKIRELNNAIKTLEYMLKHKELEIQRLREQIKSLVEVFY